MGVIGFPGRIKHIKHTNYLEHCLVHQKGFLTISCVAVVIILTIVTIYIIYILSNNPGRVGSSTGYLKSLREISNMPKVIKQERKDVMPGLGPRW